MKALPVAAAVLLLLALLPSAGAQAAQAESPLPQTPIPLTATIQERGEGPAWSAGGGPESLAQACCKVCRKGKACGDSCIAKENLCTKPKGCACDAAPLPQ
jgi:hypothetical protein